jgi:hypothetical protein
MSDFDLAVQKGVKELMYNRYFDVSTGKLTPPCIESKSVVLALNKAIGYGGAHTLNPHIGSYWLFEYLPGISISMWRTDGNKFVNERVSRSVVIEVAKRFYDEHNRKNVQLVLF